MIDAHLHLWDPERLSYPWLAHVPKIAKAHTPEDWVAAQTGVSRAVFVQADCLTEQALDEVDWIESLQNPSVTIEAIVAFAPLELGAGVIDHLHALKRRHGVRGVRRLLQPESDEFIVSDTHIAGLIETTRADLTIDLCISARQLPAVITAVDALLTSAPGARIVLDHLGKPDIAAHGPNIQGDGWDQNLRTLAARPGVFAKVSGLTTQDVWNAPRADAIRPYIDHAFACFGPDRLMYGGDWPVIDLAGGHSVWRPIFEAAITSLSAKDQARVRWGSAAEFYRIDSAGSPAEETRR